MILTKQESGRRGGRKGGKATGQSKNRMAHLSPEERSRRMSEIAKARWRNKVKQPERSDNE